MALSVVGGALLMSWLFLAVVHVDDRYNVGWVEGSKMALARSAETGVLYPPLYDGHRYGGTRFMPIPILLHAAVAKLTNEYVSSGKVVAYASTGLLLGLTFLILRGMRVPLFGAAALTAGVLATRPGLLAGTTIEGDALSVLLQLAAVAWVVATDKRPATVGAAALCTLAIGTKLSAVWAPPAISVWFLMHDRRRLLLYLGALVPLVLGMLSLFQVLSDGRLLANLAEVSFAGVGGASDVLRSPLRLIELAIDSAPVLLVVAPFALLAEPLVAGRSALSIYYLALLAAILVLLVVLSDRGATENHLLDITVLSFIVVGRAWSVAARHEAARLLVPIVAFAVLWGVGVSALVEVRPEVQRAVGAVIHGSSQPELGRVVGPRDRLLAEDPSVPVSLGRTPVVLDPWMLLRLGRSHPDWVADLAARIEHGSFDKVLLVYPLSFQAWYREVHFGEVVSDAIRESYRLAGHREGYYVYVPAAGGRGSTSP